MAHFICNSCGHQQVAAASKVGKSAHCPICHAIGAVVSGYVNNPPSAATGPVVDEGHRPPSQAALNAEVRDDEPKQNDLHNSLTRSRTVVDRLRALRLPLMSSLTVVALVLLATTAVLQWLILLRLREMGRRPAPVTIADISTLDELPVRIEEVASYAEMPVSINGISTTDELYVNLHNHYIIGGDPIPVEIVK